jgi:CHAD domain-containing protein
MPAATGRCSRAVAETEMTSRAEANLTSLTRSRPLGKVSSATTSWSDDAGSLGNLVGQALSRSVDQIARHEPGVRSGLDPEDVHQFRVGIRRLRSDLRTFAPLLKTRPQRRLGSELRWLGGAVGPVRDSDVLAEGLEADTRNLRRADPDEVALLLLRLSDQNGVARTTMLEDLASDRYGELCRTLRGIADLPPIRSKRVLLARQPASEVAAAFVRVPWQALDAGVSALGAAPGDSSLHQLRILTKRTRYAAEAVAPVVFGAAEFAKVLAGLQTVLGDHHDTVVAEAWLETAVQDSPEIARLASDLIFRQRSRRARSRAKWRTTWERAAAAELRVWL